MSDEDQIAAAFKRLCAWYAGIDGKPYQLDAAVAAAYLSDLNRYPVEAVERAMERWSDTNGKYFPRWPELKAFLPALPTQRLPPRRPDNVPATGTVVTGLLVRRNPAPPAPPLRIRHDHEETRPHDIRL